MATWNGAVGGSETAVNAVLEQLFNALSTTSNLFKFGFEIDAAGLAKADIEITQAPVASFEAKIPEQIKAKVLESAEKIDKGSNEDILDQTLNTVARSTCTLEFPATKVVLHYSDPHAEKENDEIIAHLNVVIGIELDMTLEPPAATFKAIAAKCSTDVVILTSIVNNAIIPRFLPLLNSDILKRVRIPTLSLPGLTLSSPTIFVGHGYILAYTALGQYPPVPPEELHQWPTDNIFAAADSDLIKSALNIQLRNLSLADGTFTQGSLEGSYSASLVELDQVEVYPNGSIAAWAPLKAHVKFSFDHGIPFIPKFSYTPEAVGRLKIKASAQIEQAQLFGKIEDIGDVTFDIDITGAAPWAHLPSALIAIIEGGIAKLKNLISSELEEAAKKALCNTPLKFMDIPPLTIPVNKGLHLNICNVGFTAIEASGDSYLLANTSTRITSA